MAHEFFSGLRESNEDRDWLLQNERVYAPPANRLEYPPEFDPTGILKVEDQQYFNSCEGNALSSGGEACAYLDSGGTERVQYSRWAAYIWSQEESRGGAGRDDGAEIGGGIRAAKRRGFAPEELCPYPTSYHTNIPAAAVAAGKANVLLGHTVIRSFEQGFEWINQGRGPCLIGVNWTPGIRDNTDDITEREVAGRVLGRHAMLVWGWTADGRLYDLNSHSRAWGKQGWRTVTPAAFDWWCRNCEVYGLTDLSAVTDSRPVIADLGENM